MMTPLFLYYVKASIAMSLFYLFYRLFIFSDTFFGWKRALLLGSIFLSMIYPFINLSSIFQLNEPAKEVISYYNNVLPIITIDANDHDWWGMSNISRIIWIVYLLGVVLLSFRFLIQLFTILRLASQGRRERLNGFSILRINANINPFSFFHWIFINPTLHESDDLEEILKHEETHVVEWHSLDVILSELATIPFWFNPFIWLFKRAIRQNLEFLADHRVIRSGFDTRNYQFHLLRLSHQSAAATLVNNFNVSELKKRIIMMNKKRSSLFGLTKYTLFVPLVSVLIITNQAEAIANKMENTNAVSFSKNEQPKSNSPKEVPNVKEVPAVPPIPPVPSVQSVKQVAPVITSEEIFAVTEVMPEFPGGMAGMMKYLQTNVKYPADAQQRNISGMVIVRFVVDKNGAIVNPEILRKVDPSLDNEAIRVVSTMPKWTPAKQAGKNVAVYMTLPIRFSPTEKSAKTTISGKSIPLYIVDGTPITEEKMKTIDPNTIEKIDVLKNESATKIYGERGANGVVIITLKK